MMNNSGLTTSSLTKLNNLFFPYGKSGTISVPGGNQDQDYEVSLVGGNVRSWYVFLGRLELTFTNVYVSSIKFYLKFDDGFLSSTPVEVESEVSNLYGIDPSVLQNNLNLVIQTSEFSSGGDIVSTITGIRLTLKSSTGGSVSYVAKFSVPLISFFA